MSYYRLHRRHSIKGILPSLVPSSPLSHVVTLPLLLALEEMPYSPRVQGHRPDGEAWLPCLSIPNLFSLKAFPFVLSLWAGKRKGSLFSHLRRNKWMLFQWEQDLGGEHRKKGESCTQAAHKPEGLGLILLLEAHRSGILGFAFPERACWARAQTCSRNPGSCHRWLYADNSSRWFRTRLGSPFPETVVQHAKENCKKKSLTFFF